mgnify:CR=1 FL=1
MSNYKDIHGTTVRNSAGDLSGAATGELFYDSTNRNFSYKFPNVTTSGAWASGGNLNTGRKRGAASSAGTQTASLFFGGQSDPPATNRAFTESYNGSSWTEVNDLNLARDALAGAGTTTAALAFGGRTPTPVSYTHLTLPTNREE